MKIMPKGYALIKSSQSSKLLPVKKSRTSEIFTEELSNINNKPRTSRKKNNRILNSEYPYANKNFRKNVSDSMKKCKRILENAKKQKLAFVFLKPVDPIALNIPDYLEIIKNPMDLSTIEEKLKNNEYSSPLQFGRDMRLIWKNALIYNPSGTNVYDYAMHMQDYFEKQFADLEENPGNDNYSYVADESKKYDTKFKEASAPIKSSAKPMTYQEKRNLSQSIQMLSAEHLTGVWDIICHFNNSFSKQEELIFDINNLPVETARALERYVKTKL